MLIVHSCRRAWVPKRMSHIEWKACYPMAVAPHIWDTRAVASTCMQIINLSYSYAIN
jgi:hypothetical protein